MMYDKSGNSRKANTHAQHLAAKAKGFGHSKPGGKTKRPSQKKSGY